VVKEGATGTPRCSHVRRVPAYFIRTAFDLSLPHQTSRYRGRMRFKRSIASTKMRFPLAKLSSFALQYHLHLLLRSGPATSLRFALRTSVLSKPSLSISKASVRTSITHLEDRNRCIKESINARTNAAATQRMAIHLSHSMNANTSASCCIRSERASRQLCFHAQVISSLLYLSHLKYHYSQKSPIVTHTHPSLRS